MSEMDSEITPQEKQQIDQSVHNSLLYLLILFCCIGIFMANLCGLSAWWWWAIIAAAIPVSGFVTGLFWRYFLPRMRVLPDLPSEPEEPRVVRVRSPEKLSSAGIPVKADRNLVITIFVLLGICEAIGLSYAASQNLDVSGYLFFATFSGVVATVITTFLLVIYKSWYDENNPLSRFQGVAGLRDVLDLGIKGLAFLIAFIPMFVITVMMVFFGGCAFHQEFTRTGEGIVSAVEGSRGGHKLIFADGGIFLLTSLVSEIPVAGDHFEKEFCSFRYLVNGKNIAVRDRVLSFFTPTRILPPRWLIGLMIGIILFQWLFFALYRNSFFWIWRMLDIFKSRLRAPPSRHPLVRLEQYLCLTPMPLMLALFLFYYFTLDRWM